MGTGDAYEAFMHDFGGAADGDLLPVLGQLQPWARDRLAEGAMRLSVRWWPNVERKMRFLSRRQIPGLSAEDLEGLVAACHDQLPIRLVEEAAASLLDDIDAGRIDGYGDDPSGAASTHLARQVAHAIAVNEGRRPQRPAGTLMRRWRPPVRPEEGEADWQREVDTTPRAHVRRWCGCADLVHGQAATHLFRLRLCWLACQGSLQRKARVRLEDARRNEEALVAACRDIGWVAAGRGVTGLEAWSWVAPAALAAGLCVDAALDAVDSRVMPSGILGTPGDGAVPSCRKALLDGHGTGVPRHLAGLPPAELDERRAVTAAWSLAIAEQACETASQQVDGLDLSLPRVPSLLECRRWADRAIGTGAGMGEIVAKRFRLPS